MIAVLLTATIHHGILGVSLWFDDFTDLRPWSRADLLGALTGTWDPLGVSEFYHRPLSAWLQAAQFQLFGLNTTALHALSLVGVAVATCLIGVFVLRETRRRWVAVFAMAMFVAHPGLPDAAVAVVKLQYHLVGCILAGVVLLAWQRARERPAQYWWPVWAVAAMGFYVKEDNLMLVPAVLLAQWMRSRTTGDVVVPSRRVVLSAVGVISVLLLIRAWTFPVFTDPTLGTGPVSADTILTALRAYLSGPYHVLLKIQTPSSIMVGVPGELWWWPSLIVTTLSVGGAVMTLRAPRSPDNVLFQLGVCLVAVLGIPLAVIEGPTRVHLVLFGGALTLAGGAVALAPLCRTRLSQRVAGVVALATIGAMMIAGQRAGESYLPCEQHELDSVAFMAELPQVPDDLRQYLAERPARCATGTAQPPVDAQGVLFWNMSPWEADETNAPFRWTSDHAVGLVVRGASTLTLTVRHPEATEASPVVVDIVADAGQVTRVHLRTPEWQSTTISLGHNWRTWLRDSVRVDVHTIVPGRTHAGVAMRRPDVLR